MPSSNPIPLGIYVCHQTPEPCPLHSEKKEKFFEENIWRITCYGWASMTDEAWADILVVLSIRRIGAIAMLLSVAIGGMGDPHHYAAGCFCTRPGKQMECSLQVSEAPLIYCPSFGS